jgi:hypothetical protein
MPFLNQDGTLQIPSMYLGMRRKTKKKKVFVLRLADNGYGYLQANAYPSRQKAEKVLKEYPNCCMGEVIEETWEVFA